MLIPESYVREFPFIPGGGLFFLPIGAAILLGALIRPLRMTLVWIGLALGIAAIVLGGKYLRGLPPPTMVQIAFFAAAIIAEVIAFRLIMPRVRPFGERPVLVASLAIVGAHFLIMIPTFGVPIFALGLLCLANAGAAWRAPSYPISAAWFVDGVFKMGIGLAMLLASPAFVGTF
ncbi:MAG TPA: DUF6609 family protein [Rhizomicrobium sp.]